MPQNPAVYRHLSDHYLSLPHCRAIDLQAVCTEHDQPVLSVANRADLAGRGSEGTIHGGVITALVDVASASAVAAHLPDYEVLATLDMRIDYMHPALTDRAVQAKSTCYRLAGQVAFVRTLCYQEGQSDPVALGTATFMRTPLENAEKQQLAAFLAQQQSQPRAVSAAICHRRPFSCRCRTHCKERHPDALCRLYRPANRHRCREPPLCPALPARFNRQHIPARAARRPDWRLYGKLRRALFIRASPA
jgi:uncharacterized protein (TIGR00369 family)